MHCLLISTLLCLVFFASQTVQNAIERRDDGTTDLQDSNIESSFKFLGDENDDDDDNDEVIEGPIYSQIELGFNDKKREFRFKSSDDDDEHPTQLFVFVSEDDTKHPGAIRVSFTKLSVPKPDEDFCGNDFVEIQIGGRSDIYCETPTHNIFSYDGEINIWLPSEALSQSDFEFTVTWIPYSEWCYNRQDKGLSYTGSKSTTSKGNACLPWKDVTSCPYNPFSSVGVMANLEDRSCRNPDGSDRPWCYVNAEECKKESCDVCDAAVTPMTCPKPSAVMDSNARAQYNVGEKVSYQCVPNSDLKEEMICLSDGSWMVSTTECHKCPSGYTAFNKKCYMAVTVSIPTDQREAYCSERKGQLVNPTSLESSILAHQLRYRKFKGDLGKYLVKMCRPYLGNTKACIFLCQTNIGEENVCDDTLQSCRTHIHEISLCDSYPMLKNLCTETCGEY